MDNKTRVFIFYLSFLLMQTSVTNAEFYQFEPLGIDMQDVKEGMQYSLQIMQQCWQKLKQDSRHGLQVMQKDWEQLKRQYFPDSLQETPKKEVPVECLYELSPRQNNEITIHFNSKGIQTYGTIRLSWNKAAVIVSGIILVYAAYKIMHNKKKQPKFKH